MHKDTGIAAASGRIGFASHVDRANLAAFEVLVTSLLTNNPWIDHDLVVLFDDLDALDLHRLSLLYPRIVLRHVDRAGDGARRNGADAGVDREYDRLVLLDAAMVVLGDLRELAEDVAALAGEAAGRDVLAPLDARFAVRQSAIARGADVPGDATIIHFDRPLPPWRGGELGYEVVESVWHAWDLHPVVFWRRYLSVADGASAVARAYSAWAAPYAALADEDFVDLRAAQRRHRAAGDFQAAFASLRAARLSAGGLRPAALREYGVAAMAVSQPNIARVALAHAASDVDVAPLAHTALAELEWTYRDYAAAEAAAIEAIRLHPAYGRPHQWLERIRRTRDEDGALAPGAGPRIGHVAFYVDRDGNFGDVLLPVAVRASIEDAIPDARWSSLHAHQIFDVEQARWANEHLDALVVGGGGLFLPDTAPNANSGWQWNVTDAALRELAIPVVVYAVGYNLFPGQRFHGERFRESVRLLVEKAAFVGLRNHGSVAAVREVVGAELAEKVEYLPCVTTVFGGLSGRGAVIEERTPVVLLNVAFDRMSRRFGGAYDTFVAAIADFAARLDGVAELRCLAHTKQDEQIVHDVRRAHGTSIPIDAVYGIPWQQAMDQIARADVVAGMRGHAGMIPFGIGVPILSIISHAKLRYFLEDIGRPEWGIEAADPDLAAVLESKVRALLTDREETAARLVDAQRRLRSVVDAANARIAEIIRPA